MILGRALRGGVSETERKGASGMSRRWGGRSSRTPALGSGVDRGSEVTRTVPSRSQPEVGGGESGPASEGGHEGNPGAGAAE